MIVRGLRSFANAAVEFYPLVIITIWDRRCARLAESGRRISFIRNSKTRMNLGVAATTIRRLTSIGRTTIPLRRPDGSLIEFFPAHPHEGAVGLPAEGGPASVIATSKSLSTARPFNLLVAFEKAVDAHGNTCGRAIAESSFHHLVDYNWNPELGCPPFLEEPPGDEYRRFPEKLNDIKRYVENAAAWLAKN